MADITEPDAAHRHISGGTVVCLLTSPGKWSLLQPDTFLYTKQTASLGTLECRV